MAQFIRDHCNDDARTVAAVRRLHDRYILRQHRLALRRHPIGRSRRQALPPSRPQLRRPLQEAVCGLMQAIDRFDVSHGLLARRPMRRGGFGKLCRSPWPVGTSSSLSPHTTCKLGLLQQESEAGWPTAAKHLPTPQELGIAHSAAQLRHLTHLQTATRTPVSLSMITWTTTAISNSPRRCRTTRARRCGSTFRASGGVALPDGETWQPPASVRCLIYVSA